jgi:asparagine synthase (glutamine-hydrolysing)
MFAFAVWDEREKALFLARDRMGQKPLYIAHLPTDIPKSDGLHVVNEWEHGVSLRGFAFASEMSAIASLPWVDREVEPQAVLRYLQWGYVQDQSSSIYRGVSQVLPGLFHCVSREEAPFERYFDSGVQLGMEASRAADPVRRTRELVQLAAKRQMVADVPVGCFLSGGVDSSVVAASMKAAAGDGQAVMTFSIGFDDPRYDETEYAAAVAKHLRTSHHAFKVTPDAVQDLPKLAAVFGEPFGDSSALPTHYLARETRRHVKVALSGDGGDELFGGYDRYRAMHLGRRLRTIGTPIAWMAVGALAARSRGGHPKSSGRRARRFLGSLRLRSAARYASYLRLMDDALIHELVAKPRILRGEYDDVEACFEAANRHLDVVRSAMSVDRWHYLPDDLLTKVDRASMLHALEVRSPFMDHELVEFAAGLTTDQLLKGGPKRMLREAFADDLPAWVFKRKKMGFAVPIGEWFRGELRPMLRDSLFASDAFGRHHFDMKVVERLVDEHEKQTVDHSQRLYALLMLELWWRTSR